jgi:hypothetical protein
MPAFLPSELPIQAEVRHHWVVLFRRPHLFLIIVLLALFVLAIIQPWPMAVPLVVVLALMGFVRWQTWRAERIIITQKRIVRVRGVPESTTQEASLRLDRISGAIVVQTVPGKLLRYASIELEAAGNHPDFRHLNKIEHPDEFYLKLRHIIFGAGVDPVSAVGIAGDDEGRYPDEYETAPLPTLKGSRPVWHRR